ncbi:MAG: helix-turn-helix domain-containing protein [Bacteroidota bacterium]|nr:helix-turn-helix domain-containing protein [Bacteroidota bacterium]
MAILQLKPHLTVAQVRERMQKEQQVYCFQRWQMLHAVATNKGMTAQAVALLLGSSAHAVRRTVQLYNKQGADFLEKLSWGPKREALPDVF